MAESREELLNRARMLYLTGSDPSGLRFLLKNKLGLSDVEISQTYTGWNIEQQQARYRKQAEARLAGATYTTGPVLLPPKEPRKISNLFGLMRRRGVPQSDLERIAQEVEIARFKGGKITGAGIAKGARAASTAGKFVSTNKPAAAATAAAIAAGTAAVPFVPPMAPAYAPQEARNIVRYRAEVVAADKFRQLIKGKKQLDENAVRQIMEATARDVAKRYPKFKIEEMLSEEDIVKNMMTGIASAREQVGYYEKEFGGRYAGQAVRKLEQAGAAASYAAQKTPVVGDILFGKVGPAARMENLPPLVRSAINKGRIMLQKEAPGVKKELDNLAAKAEDDLKKKEAELRGAKAQIEKILRKLRQEGITANAPGAQQEKTEGGEGGQL